MELPPKGTHTVTLQLAGSANLAQHRGGRAYEGAFVKGDLSLVPAGRPSTWRTEDGEFDPLHLHVEPGLVRRAAEAAGEDPDRTEILDRFAARDPHVEHVGLSLMSELQTGGLAGDLYAESLANVLAVLLLRNHSSARGRPDGPVGGLPKSALRRSVDYINDNLGQTLRLDEIAREAAVSPYHFARLFKASTGLSPHRYVIERRVRRAEELLLREDAQIAEVARAVGFANQSHLTSHFRRLVGVAPGAFRKKART